MQISKQELRQIIKEEIDTAIEEGLWDQVRSQFSGASEVPGAIKSRIGSTWDQFRSGESEDQPGSIRGPQSKYAQGKAIKILTIHRKKFIKNMKRVIADHFALAKDFRNDTRALGLHDPKGAAAEEIKHIEEILTRFKTQMKYLRKNIDPLFTNAIESIQAGLTPEEPSAADDTPEEAEDYIYDLDQGTDDLEISAGPDPDDGSSTEDIHSRAEDLFAQSRKDRADVEAQMAARAKKRAARSPRLEEAQELTQWKKRAGIKEK